MSNEFRAQGDFVGRTAELAALNAALAHAANGRGRVVMLVGEAGIGKTRTAAEFAAEARAAGAVVLRSGCYEGEWAPPYGPFVEALTAYVRAADPELLRDELGFGAAPLARLLPAIRERMPDVPEPVALQPDEERFRLFDAVSQFLIAIAMTRTVVLLLDDLHWVDRGTIALLRHVARFAPGHRLLVVGTYRDEEIDATHPLAELLGLLRRESSFERVGLKGLDQMETEALAFAVADHGLASSLLADIHRYTQGNPFFIRETVQLLVEEGRLSREQAALPELAVPQGIRHIVQRRLARLSTETQHLLTIAAAFEGPFRYDIAGRAAEIEHDGLTAVDEALRARIIVPTSMSHTYDFSHALIRLTLYSGLSPSRRAHLHRRLAEELACVHATTPANAREVAEQYHRSKDLPGAERGVGYAMDASDQAFVCGDFDIVARLLGIALDLLPQGDTRRPRCLARLGLTLGFAMKFDEAVAAATEAAEQIAGSENDAAAAQYVAQAIVPLEEGGFYDGAFTLAALGLRFAGSRRDATWVVLRSLDIVRGEMADPQFPGIVLDTPERRELAEVFEQQPSLQREVDAGRHFSVFLRAESREQVRQRGWITEFIRGDYREGLAKTRELAASADRDGRLARALLWWSETARYCTALGNVDDAEVSLGRARERFERLPIRSHLTSHLAAAEDEWRMAMDEQWGAPMPWGGPRAERPVWPHYRAATYASVARSLARLGKPEKALQRIESLIPAIERAPGWVENYTRLVCDVVETLWFARSTPFADTIKKHLHEKVVIPGFCHPMMDGRLAMARLSALQGLDDDARDWFAKARTVLDDQGARPLRAIVDYDEALMYARHGAKDGRDHARQLVEAALKQFRAIGMPGWIRRAEHLLATGTEWSPAVHATPPAERTVTEPGTRDPGLGTKIPAPEICSFRCDGDVWSISFAGNTQRLKDTRGLHYLAQLFAHPRREFHVSELASLGAAPVSSVARAAGEQPTAADLGDAGEVLDSEATVQYQRRLTEVREELDQAESNNDVGRSARLREELEFLIAELASAGRGRRAASHAERARSAVGKRIRDALRQIDTVDPTLGRYLRATIRTGTFCSYTPDPRLRVDCEPYR